MARYWQIQLAALMCTIASAVASLSMPEVDGHIQRLELEQLPALEPLIMLQQQLFQTVRQFDEQVQNREQSDKENNWKTDSDKSQGYYLNLHVNVVAVGLDGHALQSWLSTASQDTSLADLVIGKQSRALRNVGYR